MRKSSRSRWALIGLLVVPLVFCFSSFSIAVETDVTDKIELVKSGLRYDRRTRTTSLFVSLRNISQDDTWSAPVKVIIDSISSQAVTVANADGTTADGKPYFLYDAEIDGGQLEPGATSGNKKWVFNNSSRARFTFDVEIWADVGPSDVVPPTISITNPVNNSTITSATPYITIEFSDDDSGVNLSSCQIQINGADSTSLFTITDTRATFQVTTPLGSGSNVISASISDNAGNTSTAVSNFTIGSSTQPMRYIFSVSNNDWIFASPGDGTCVEYLSRGDLGLLSFSDVVALSKVTPDGNVFFTLTGQGGILQSPTDGSNTVYFDNSQLGLEDDDQICAEHTGLDGSAFFAVDGQADIYESSGLNTNSFYKGNSELGLGDDIQVGCLHIGYDGKAYFCRSDASGIFESTGDGTNTQFLTAANLGVQGSTIDAFAILPEAVPPEITITNPVDGAFLNTTTPNITVTFQDGDSGIDTATFYAEINGADMTSAFAVTETGASYQVPSGSPLPVDDNTLFVRIQDRVGNEGDATSNFNIGILRAIPGATPTSGPAPLTVYFTTDGEDPAGTIQFFRWDFDGNGTYDTYDTVARDYNHTYNTAGIYNATLHVWSSTGETASASITITAENNPPVATADVVPSNGEVPLTVQMMGSGSDVDGSIVLYEWDFEGGGTYDWSSATTGNTSHTYTAVGVFNAVFRVTDNSGLTDSATATTTVVRTGPPGSPTATASASPSTGNAPLNVNFYGTATDPDNDVVLYEWDFENDGTYDWSSATSGNTSHTYNAAGTHVASLRVTDSTGLTGIDQILITVNIQTSLSVGRDTVGFIEESSQSEIASASASSQYPGYPPSNAIDGNMGSYWIAAPGDNVPDSWFEVTFTRPQRVDGLTVHWYSSTYMMQRGRIEIYDESGSTVYSQETDMNGLPSQVSIPGVEDAARLRLVTVSTATPYYHVINEFTVDSTPMSQEEPDPEEPTGTNINTSISAGSQVSILIKDADGNVVRTLVNNENRDMGSYVDYWDCKDDNGIVVNDGVHYAILQYIVDGQVQTYDLTDSTGGSRYTGFRANTGGSQSSPATFRPFEDDFLPIGFTLNNAAEVTLFVGYLWGQDTRIRTLTNRVPFPAGTHTVYWDGLDDNEQLATAPPGWYLIPGAWAYTLPDNAMYMTGGSPQITDIAAEPNYFSPFSEKCDENGMDEGIILIYNVSENVAQVEFRVYSLETGALLRTDVQNNILSGENTYFWDGKNNNGEYVDIGDYQVGIIATDGDGNVSMLRYTLIRVDY